MNPDWIMIDIAIPNEYYRSHTELSFTFKLWHKRQIRIPTKFIQNMGGTNTHFIMQLPRWYVNQWKLHGFTSDKPTPEVIQEPMPLLDAQPLIVTAAPTITEVIKEKARTQEPRRLF